METKKNTEKLANFYLDVMELENDAEALEWKVVLDPQQLKQWEEGESAMGLAPPELPWQIAFDRFCTVARSCQNWQTGPQPVSKTFLKTLEDLNEPQKEAFILSLLKVDGEMAKWAKQLEVSIDLLDFIARITFKPFLKIYGQAVLEQVQLNDWTKSHCPICGDQPTMAKLTGQDGHRELYCGRCETEWRYRRLGCPYCKDDNASQASFITLDDSKQYRIYLCERCKSYLKTVDERVSGEVDLFCEDLATVELDQLAQAEGYQRGDKRQQV